MISLLLVYLHFLFLNQAGQSRAGNPKFTFTHATNSVCKKKKKKKKKKEGGGGGGGGGDSDCGWRQPTKVVSGSFSLQAAVAMSNSEKFLDAAAKVKALTARPSDQELLDLYGYYKQATIGDTNIDRPSMFYYKERAKWDNWNSRKGISKEEAEKSYIGIVDALMSKYPSS